jgi:hypothetical protein
MSKKSKLLPLIIIASTFALISSFASNIFAGDSATKQQEAAVAPEEQNDNAQQPEDQSAAPEEQGDEAMQAEKQEPASK